ncbi:phosphopentomutase [Virgibacillus pantothenticus]|uniref:phosphopentomutase n=1 Tax=Virgibacillus pantothenticus TaxID=1473 RepID=UPI001B08506F|nr:phosphopentomutase [Virgibacillus pantothenticus]MBU8565009.1 phosphopentomutase [Virgibacillus pantothenticus]MBU8599316.1 phosphopentomutase [Virgibacillus pantothenticus]MBU8633281.1 phosphopentomutase [Virgibacillus pantothenticus]MBU8641058.1 phosphopentomutase [Virgibacillus pantothenticus]MBU8645013.1 phosphopentomutase [Virgibacillus pantothenticus]
MAKLTLFVIDSFGIGAMDDCAEYNIADCSANTYKHIRDVKQEELQIPFMYNAGLGTLVDGIQSPSNAYGCAKLAHHGADTYLGHQEIVGSCPKKSNKRLIKDIHVGLKLALEAAGYTVTYPIVGCPVLLVNNAAVVADNLESAYGNIINVTADFKKMPFSMVKQLGRVVRQHVDTSRVIAFGGPYTSIEHILSCVIEKQMGQWGVDTPKAKVYGKGYDVYHMGYGVEIDKQFPMIAAKHGLKVYRLGKTADVLHGEGPANPIVNTSKLLQSVSENYLAEQGEAAFLINIQETDLAGHSQNVDWYCQLLNEVDRWLSNIFLPLMAKEDILIVMADHGNDPTIGHANHTREYVPILIFGEKVNSVNIGLRETMADVGTTICDFFHFPSTAEGKSFLADILNE